MTKEAIESDSSDPGESDGTIVDTDVHLTVSLEEAAEYMDEPHRSTAKSNTYGSVVMNNAFDQNMGGKITHQSIDGPETIQQTLVEDFGIDYPIINSAAPCYKTPQSEFAVALMRAYNDVLIEKYLDEFDHFRGLGTIATHKPAKAAEEIDRLANEDQIVGAFIVSTGPYPQLGDEDYDVIYQAAEDNGMTIAFHGSADTFQVAFPFQNHGAETFLEVHTLAHTWSQMLTLTSLLVNGTPVKFPDLNFVMLEAGIGWIPYMMFRMNKEYSIRRSEAPLLERSPEEHIRESFYFASQPIGEPNDPRHMQQLMDMIGYDTLMFSSDYPHWDFDHPDGVDRYLRGMDPEKRDAMLYRTPVEAFDLDV